MTRLIILLLLQITALAGNASDYERFEENGKVGIKDHSGKVVLPPSFDALGWSDGSFSLNGQVTGYRKQNQWGLLNLKKEFITQAMYESLTSLGGDRVIAGKEVNSFTTKFGCLDLQGKVVIPFIYDEIQLHDLRAIVMVKQGTQYQYGLIDLNGDPILPLLYQKIEPLGSLRFVVKDFNNKSALCSETGSWITGFIIDSISDFQFDLAVIYQGWKCGIIDRNGQIKIEPIYRELSITAPDRIRARKSDEWRVISLKQEILLKVECDEMIFGLNGWNRVRLNGRWGFVDDQFKMLWPAVYEGLGPNKNQHVVAMKDSKYRLFRADQSEVLPSAFDSIRVHGDLVSTLTRAMGKSSWSLYDTFGIKKTATDYDLMEPFNHKFFPVKKHGYWGAVNRYGQEQIACVYDSLLTMNGELMTVKFKGQYGIISLDDQWRVSPQPFPIRPIAPDRYLETKDSLFLVKDFSGNIIYFTNNRIEPSGESLYEQLPDGTVKEINLLGQIVKRVEPIIPQKEVALFYESEGLTGIKRDGKFGFVDMHGRLRIANRYDGIGEFHHGLCPVKLLGKWGFINAADEIVIQPTFDVAENFDQEVSLVTRKGKSGLINMDGNILLELRYDSVKKLPSGMFLLMQDDLQGLSDSQGRILIEPRFEQLKILDNRWVSVKQTNHYGLLTLDGMSILPVQYSNLSYLEGQGNQEEFLVHLKSEWQEVEIK